MKMQSLRYMALSIGLLVTCLRADNTDNTFADSRSDSVHITFEGNNELHLRNVAPEMWERLQRVSSMEPYTYRWAYTLGKLSQGSHDILIARVLYPDDEKDAVDDVETKKAPDDVGKTDIVSSKPSDVLYRDTVLIFQPEEYLLRQRGGYNHIIAFYRIGPRKEPTEGDRYLVFLRYREMPRAEALILGEHYGITGLINVDTDDGADIIETARRYVKHLRGDAFDHGAYFKFLHDLLDHPVERIRKDAKMDLMRLIDDSDAEQLIEVERIDNLKEDIRWYVGYRRKWKTGEYQRPPPPEPSAEVIEKLRTLMQSESQEEIREGMDILREYSGWHRANPDRWVDVALPLLEHPNKNIRRIIAQRLTTVGHPSGVPVIIEESLRHESWPIRDSGKGFLQRMLGKEIDFDPRASEEDRKEQVEAFKQWWEENKHRYEYE